VIRSVSVSSRREAPSWLRRRCQASDWVELSEACRLPLGQGSQGTVESFFKDDAVNSPARGAWLSGLTHSHNSLVRLHLLTCKGPLGFPVGRETVAGGPQQRGPDRYSRCPLRNRSSHTVILWREPVDSLGVERSIEAVTVSAGRGYRFG
jgi:hypothetical protein